MAEKRERQRELSTSVSRKASSKLPSAELSSPAAKRQSIKKQSPRSKHKKDLSRQITNNNQFELNEGDAEL